MIRSSGYSRRSTRLKPSALLQCPANAKNGVTRISRANYPERHRQLGAGKSHRQRKGTPAIVVNRPCKTGKYGFVFLNHLQRNGNDLSCGGQKETKCGATEPTGSACEMGLGRIRHSMNMKIKLNFLKVYIRKFYAKKRGRFILQLGASRRTRTLRSNLNGYCNKSI